MKKTANKTDPRKPSAKRSQKSGTPGSTGNLTNEEKGKLCIQAKEALAHQIKLGNLPEDTNLNDFRRDQVIACVGLAGVSKINRSHWREVSGHFLTLAGREAEALELELKTGEKTYRGGNPGDTWEDAETYAHNIKLSLAKHLTADLAPGMARIFPGWILDAARQRTGKPGLTMDTLAERLDPKTLHGLLSHFNNHIALREGRADLERRSVRSYPAKPDPSQIDDPF